MGSKGRPLFNNLYKITPMPPKTNQQIADEILAEANAIERKGRGEYLPYDEEMNYVTLPELKALLDKVLKKNV